MVIYVDACVCVDHFVDVFRIVIQFIFFKLIFIRLFHSYCFESKYNFRSPMMSFSVDDHRT